MRTLIIVIFLLQSAPVLAQMPTTVPALPPPDKDFDSRLTDLLDPAYDLPLSERLRAFSNFARATRLDQSETYPIQRLLRYCYDHPHPAAIPMAPLVMSHFFAKSFGFEPAQYAKVLVPYYDSPDPAVRDLADTLLQGALFYRIESFGAGLDMPNVHDFVFGVPHEFEALPPMFWRTVFYDLPWETMLSLTSPGTIDALSQQERELAILLNDSRVKCQRSSAHPDARAAGALRSLSASHAWPVRFYCLATMDQNASFMDIDVLRRLSTDPSRPVREFGQLLLHCSQSEPPIDSRSVWK